MRALRTVVLGCGLLLAAGPARAQDQDARKLIVGKWETTVTFEGKEVKVQLDFTRDGKASLTVRDIVTSGKYEFKGDNTIEAVWNLKDGGSKKSKHEVKVTADTLELKDEKGKVDKFKRVKTTGGGKG